MRAAPRRGETSRSTGGRTLRAYAGGVGPVRLLVHGAIHGDEPGAADLVRRFIAAADPEGEGPRWVAVPTVNPDGLHGATKDNARGVDLNRNFDAKSWRAEHRPGYNPGPKPLSEPESRFLARLIERHRPARIVAVHQPFRCVNYDGPAKDLAERMAAACGWPVQADLGYPTPGSFGSRYGIDAGLPVITLELPRPASAEDLAAGLRALKVALKDR